MGIVKWFSYTMVLMVMLIAALMFISDFIIIGYYEDEASVAITNSVTESFSTLSLENLSDRSGARENRNINLVNVDAVERLKASLKSNLNLDESLIARPGSFLIDREAVKIRNINIVTSSMLPLNYKNQVLNEESIIVELDLPINLSFAKEKKFMKISKVVSLETFLTVKEK